MKNLNNTYDETFAKIITGSICKKSYMYRCLTKFKIRLWSKVETDSYATKIVGIRSILKWRRCHFYYRLNFLLPVSNIPEEKSLRKNEHAHFVLPLLETLCTICYYLYNLKNVRKTLEGVLLLVNLLTLWRTCAYQEENVNFSKHLANLITL